MQSSSIIKALAYKSHGSVKNWYEAAIFDPYTDDSLPTAQFKAAAEWRSGRECYKQLAFLGELCKH